MSSQATDTLTPNPTASDAIANEAAMAHVQAWLVWLVCLFVPAGLLLAGWGVLQGQMTPERPVWGVVLGVFAGLWLLVLFPLALWLRGHVLVAHLSGKAMRPSRYVKGMATIWAVAGMGGALGGLGCLLGGGWLPAGLPLLLALVCVLTLAPVRMARD